MKDLKEALNRLNVTAYRYSWHNLPLEALVKRAQIAKVKVSKQEYIRVLENYLSDSKQLKAIWQKLSNFEKAIVTDAVVNKGYLLAEEVERLCKVYGEKQDKLVTSSYICLYFIAGSIPKSVANELATFIEIPKMTLQEEIVNGKTLRNHHVYRSNDKLAEDWVNLIKLVGLGSLKVTKAGQFPTKATLKKINQQMIHKEYESSEITLDAMKNGGEAIRLYGLVETMIKAKVLDTENTDLILGVKAKEFLCQPFAKQAQILFEAYKNNSTYNEVERIKLEKLEVSLPDRIPLVRQDIIHLISSLPEEQWINMKDLREQIYKCWRTFLVEHVGSITEKNADYYFGRYRIEDWERIEVSYLDVLLLEGLAPLGIIDVALSEETIEHDYTSGSRFSVAYFKITPLGAYLFGKNQNYIDPSTHNRVPNDLWVDDSLTINIGDSVKRYQHEMFFDRFCEKLEQEKKSVYTLNFYAALKAFNENIGLDEILTYLQSECTKPLPLQLERMLKQWKLDQQKVCIKNVTIIECEDESIMRDLMQSNILIKNDATVLNHAISIPEKHINKFKKEIESKNYFCKIIKPENGGM